MIIFGRSVARSLGRSVARSLDRSLGRSIARSVARSLARSLGRSLDSLAPKKCDRNWYGFDFKQAAVKQFRHSLKCNFEEKIPNGGLDLQDFYPNQVTVPEL